MCQMIFDAAWGVKYLVLNKVCENLQLKANSLASSCPFLRFHSANLKTAFTHGVSDHLSGLTTSVGDAVVNGSVLGLGRLEREREADPKIRCLRKFYRFVWCAQIPRCVPTVPCVRRWIHVESARALSWEPRVESSKWVSSNHENIIKFQKINVRIKRVTWQRWRVRSFIAWKY